MLRGVILVAAFAILSGGHVSWAHAQAGGVRPAATPSLVDLAREFVLAQDKGTGGWSAFLASRAAQWEAAGSDVQMGDLQARTGIVNLGPAGHGEVTVTANKGRLQEIYVQILSGKGRVFGPAGFSAAMRTHLPGINPIQVRGACPDASDGMPSVVYRVQLPGAGQAHVFVFSVIEPGKVEPLASGFAFSRRYEHDWLCDHDHGPGADHKH